MKKIVIFYPHIGEYGGIERNIIALATEIKNRNLEPILLCYYDRINMKKHSGNILTTVVLGNHWNPFVKGLKLKRYFNQYQNEIQGMPFYFGAKAGFYGVLGFKNDYALHYTDPPSLVSNSINRIKLKHILQIPRETVSNFISKKGVHNAAACLTMTKTNAIELKNIYKRSFQVFYQGGVPYQGNKEFKKKCESRTLRLFSICRLSKSKNLDWIIEASNDLLQNEDFKKDFNNLEIVIAGKGPELENLIKKANHYGIQSNFYFPGFLTSEELELAYENSDMFLVPGRQGFGLPILEALYREIPVVMNLESRASEILFDNPWVAISKNTNESFSEQLTLHLQSIKKNYPSKLLLNELPTEQHWASQIGTYCKWWN